MQEYLLLVDVHHTGTTTLSRTVVESTTCTYLLLACGARTTHGHELTVLMILRVVDGLKTFF